MSWGIYPLPTGSSVIVDNIVTNFPHSEMVVIGEKAPNLQKGNDNKDRTNNYHVSPNISLFGKGKGYLRWLNLNKVVRYIQDIALKEKCTAILAIFPDEFYMYAAYKASQQMNLPFYTWFHNTYIDNRAGLLKLLAKRWQPKFFETAHTNFVMSDGMLDFYKEKYPDTSSFKTLVHGFDIPDVEYTPFQPNQPVKRFVFSGGLNESCRDATVRLIKTIIQKPDYHVHLFTGTPMSVFESYGIRGDNVHHEGFMPLEAFASRFPEFDIMLLPHGFDGARTDIEYQTIFPTRTIPILYSNRPILAHTPKNVFLTKFLRQHDCAEIVDEKDENAIHTAIDKLLNNGQHREKLVKNAIRTAAIFDVKNVTQQLRQAIFNQ